MAAPTFDVVGVGENSLDFVYRIQGAPAPNAKLPATAHHVSCGGQVATALCTCASFGLRTAYLGAFGGDGNGERVREALASRGVDISHSIVRDGLNRSAVILVNERTGDRTVVWERDPRLVLRPGDISLDVVRAARLLHVDDFDEEASIETARAATAADIPVTSDIDRITERTSELAASVTVPIFASHVPLALTGETDAERALRKLQRVPEGWLSVTLGPQGAMLLAGDRLHHVPAFDVDAVDTTGAGDVFRGAFIYGLLKGQSPERILRFAAAAAALSCTREGALESVPSLADVERLLAASDERA